MSYCPVPDTTQQIARAPASLVLTPPAPTDETCNAAITESTIAGPADPIETNTGVPGPAGPPGPPGQLILMQDGVELGPIEKLNFIGCQQLVTVNGVQGDVESEALSFAGKWDIGLEYCKHDVALFDPPLPDPETALFGLLKTTPKPLNGDGDAWVCLQSHTSAEENKPGTTGGDAYWERMTAVQNNAAKADSTFLDKLKGIYSWVLEASVGDWLSAIAIGSGIIWAGNEIIDQFEDIGSNTGSTPADSRFNGTLTYSGPYSHPSIREVVESLCAKVIPAGQYDASLLSDTMTCSISLQQVTSIRTLLDQLSQLYLFDMVDSSGVLKFVPRASTPVATLTHLDMAFNSSGVSEPPVVYKRLQSIDLPRSVQLTYIAQDLDYNSYTQITMLPTFADGQDVTLSVPVVLDHYQAKELTEQMLINAHLERQTYTFKTSYVNAIELEPGDVITIPEGNVRILSMEETEEGLIEFVCCLAGFNGPPEPVVVGGVTIGYKASTYTTSGQPPQIPAVPVNQAPSIGYSGVLFIDPPALSADDTNPRVFAAVHGFGDERWPGAQLFRSQDNGQSYVQIAQTRNSATFGLVRTAAPNGDYHVFDDTSVIRVQLKTGSLMSVTDEALFNGANMCMIGQEVLQFGVATLVDPKTYELTHLLRGRQGTEFAVSNHSADELFIMLDDSLVEIEAAPDERAKPYLYKIVTLGSDLTKVDPKEISIVGNNTLPWTVTNLSAEKNASDSYVISWFERPRFVNSLMDYTDIPHDHDFGGFMVAIYDDFNNEPKRTMFVYDPYYFYTKEQQIEDFGSAQTSLKAKVFQVSNLYGGGRPAIIDI